MANNGRSVAVLINTIQVSKVIQHIMTKTKAAVYTWIRHLYEARVEVDLIEVLTHRESVKVIIHSKEANCKAYLAGESAYRDLHSIQT